jgi:hypothetical protein
MAIFRGVGGSGSSSDNSFLQEVTAQATTATTKANEASASATSAANSLATIQNTEVTSASFNTGDGVLTLTKLGGATVTADLDGRFLTSYTETNDLSSAVTWANVPDANITESSVTQHLTASNVANAGALMDSEVTNLAQVKAFDSSDYATAAQGSTADSALQNLVEDTTPQLGGNLDLNGNDITGTGNIDFDGNIKTDFIEGSEYSSSNLNFYDTATQGGNGTTLSSTAGLSFKYDTNNNDTDGFKVFANGNSTACFTINNSENVQATGNITADNGFFSTTGSFTTSSGNIVTNSGNLSTNAGNIIANSGTLTLGSDATIGGNISVTGTVDGRDVAADGTKLDGITSEASASHNYTTQLYQGYLTLTTSVNQVGPDFYLRNYSDNHYKRFAEVAGSVSYSGLSSTNDLNLRTILVVPSSSGNAVDIGSVDSITTTSTYNRDIVIVGDVSHWFSEYSGTALNSNGTSTFSSIVSAVYNPTTNKTTINAGVFGITPPSVGDSIYVHPFDWESSGTEIYGVIKQLDADNESTMTYEIYNKVYFGNIDRVATCRIKLYEAASSDSIVVQRLRVYQLDERA